MLPKRNIPIGDHMDNGNTDKDVSKETISAIDLWIRIIISVIAILVLVFKSVYWHDESHAFSRDELILVGIAIAPWLSQFVKTFKIGKDGIDVTTQDLKKVEAIANAAFDVGKNPPKVEVPTVNTTLKSKTATDTLSDADNEAVDDAHAGDPNFAVFGDNPTKDGRKLSVTIEEIPGKDFYRRVIARVESTDKKRGLKGKVRFFLHPTFRTPAFDVPVRDGVAETSFVSYGVFTIGVKADNGETDLGYNLCDYPHDPSDPWFLR